MLVEPSGIMIMTTHRDTHCTVSKISWDRGNYCFHGSVGTMVSSLRCCGCDLRWALWQAEKRLRIERRKPRIDS